MYRPMMKDASTSLMPPAKVSREPTMSVTVSPFASRWEKMLGKTLLKPAPSRTTPTTRRLLLSLPAKRYTRQLLATTVTWSRAIIWPAVRRRAISTLSARKTVKEMARALASRAASGSLRWLALVPKEAENWK